MKKISLITVYNNKELLDDLVKSAQTQVGLDVEYVLIDNSHNEFSSAAKALNHGSEIATGDVFVFLHQDIEFVSNDVLQYIYDFANDNKNTLFGAAGVKSLDKNNKGNILANIYAGPDKGRYKTLDKPTKVSTLDECLIACHSSCFKKIKFDDIVCDGWHLYGVDLCLQAQAFANMDVYVIPMEVWHKSNGNADKSYFKCQNRLGKKYRKHYKSINTTNSYVYTNLIKRFALNVYRTIRYGSSSR